MFLDVRTQAQYKTRKEAKQVLGHAEFNRLARTQQLIFIPTNNPTRKENTEIVHV